MRQKGLQKVCNLWPPWHLPTELGAGLAAHVAMPLQLPLTVHMQESRKADYDSDDWMTSFQKTA